jgi:hypothetical protein
MAIMNTKGDRLVALFFLGALLFNYPILSIFNRATLVFGIPRLYLYFFISWMLIIALVCIATSFRSVSYIDNVSHNTTGTEINDNPPQT